jgi:hypothetical protein
MQRPPNANEDYLITWSAVFIVPSWMKVGQKLRLKKKDKKEKSHFKLFVSHIIGGEHVFLFKPLRVKEFQIKGFS